MKQSAPVGQRRQLIGVALYTNKASVIQCLNTGGPESLSTKDSDKITDAHVGHIIAPDISGELFLESQIKINKKYKKNRFKKIEMPASVQNRDRH